MRLQFRKPNADEINFVHNSWLHSAHLSGLAASDLARLLPRLAPHITLAVVEVDGEDSIVGWMAATTEPAACVYYAYVKECFRKSGVFTALLEHHFGRTPACLQYVFEGGKLTAFLAQKYRAIRNPFFAIGRI